MDIGIVHPELVDPRGAEKQVCELCYHLNRMGHQVTLYTFNKKDAFVFDPLLEGVNVVSLKKKSVMNSLLGLSSVRWFYLIKKLSKKIKKHDILNVHNHPSQWMSKYVDMPTIWMCNEPYMRNASNFRRFFSLNNLFDKFMLREVQMILTFDNTMKKIIKTRYPEKKVQIVGSGGGLIREINHVHDDYFDSIFIGPLSHPKRPLDIVNAFSNLNKEIPNSRLHFVIGKTGIVSNRIKKEMIELANENDLEIFFYGSLSDERLYELYDLADIAVFVPESEPWGIFPLETLLGNIPTVISDQCGMKSVLPDNDLIVETGNIEEISNKILDIYKNYEDYKFKTSQIAKIVRAEYSWETYTKRMLECFNELI